MVDGPAINVGGKVWRRTTLTHTRTKHAPHVPTLIPLQSSHACLQHHPPKYTVHVQISQHMPNAVYDPRFFFFCLVTFSLIPFKRRDEERTYFFLPLPLRALSSLPNKTNDKKKKTQKFRHRFATQTANSAKRRRTQEHRARDNRVRKRYAPKSLCALSGAEVLGLVAALADLVNRQRADGALGGGVDALLDAAALAHNALALLVEDAPCGSPADLGSLLLLHEQALVLGVDEVVHGAIAADEGATVAREDGEGAERAFDRPGEKKNQARTKPIHTTPHHSTSKAKQSKQSKPAAKSVVQAREATTDYSGSFRSLQEVCATRTATEQQSNVDGQQNGSDRQTYLMTILTECSCEGVRVNRYRRSTESEKI